MKSCVHWLTPWIGRLRAPSPAAERVPALLPPLADPRRFDLDEGLQRIRAIQGGEA